MVKRISTGVRAKGDHSEHGLEMVLGYKEIFGVLVQMFEDYFWKEFGFFLVEIWMLTLLERIDGFGAQQLACMAAQACQ